MAPAAKARKEPRRKYVLEIVHPPTPPDVREAAERAILRLLAEID